VGGHEKKGWSSLFSRPAMTDDWSRNKSRHRKRSFSRMKEPQQFDAHHPSIEQQSSTKTALQLSSSLTE
jgi:hypothetical protein